MPFIDYSIKGPFNAYFIYFTFVKSVAINKDLISIQLLESGSHML